MTGVRSLFPRASFVGFDHFLAEVDIAAKQASENYPPHNIVKVTVDDYLIEMAVAGFSQEELTVEVKDRSLTVYLRRNLNASLGCLSSRKWSELI